MNLFPFILPDLHSGRAHLVCEVSLDSIAVLAGPFSKPLRTC